MQNYNTSYRSVTRPTAAVLLTLARERQLVYGTPVQLLHTQTEVVAYKPTLARPSPRNSHYSIGGRRCGGCDPSSGVVDELLLLLLLL